LSITVTRPATVPPPDDDVELEVAAGKRDASAIRETMPEIWVCE
jgi:hypothetical protein